MEFAAALQLPNKYTGYVYLVDRNNKVSCSLIYFIQSFIQFSFYMHTFFAAPLPSDLTHTCPR